MKSRNNIGKIVFLLFVSIFFFSCRHTRYLTEQYIKANIETHTENEFSRLETYTILQKRLRNQSGSFHGFAYLELTGYKHNGKAGMVIGAEKYHFMRKVSLTNPFEKDVTYINLDLNQCKELLSNHKELRVKIEAEKTKPFIVIYQDFNASKDFYIGYKAVLGKSRTKNIDFWIKGERYRIKSRVFMKKFMKFMKYYASE